MVPGTLPVKVTAVVFALLQTTWLTTAFTVGVGLTVMVNVIDGPVQVIPPLVKVGVTVIIATTGTVVGFVAVNAGMLPVPDAPKPILGVLFVQLNTVPGTLPPAEPPNTTRVVNEPLHNT